MIHVNYLRKALLALFFLFKASTINAQNEISLYNLVGTLKNTTKDSLTVRIPKNAEFVSQPKYQVLVLHKIVQPRYESGLIEDDDINGYYIIKVPPKRTIDVEIEAWCKNKYASVQGGRYICTQSEHIELTIRGNSERNAHQQNQLNNDKVLVKSEQKVMLVVFNGNNRPEAQMQAEKYCKDKAVTSVYYVDGQVETLKEDPLKEKHLIKKYLCEKSLCKGICNIALNKIEVIKELNDTEYTISYRIESVTITLKFSGVRTVINSNKREISYFALSFNQVEILSPLNTYKAYCQGKPHK